MIHAKVFIIDNEKAVIGSINLTRASLDDNRELAVITEDPTVLKQLIHTFDQDWKSENSPPPLKMTSRHRKFVFKMLKTALSEALNF